MNNEKNAHDNLYAAVFSSYVQQLMEDGQNIEFFLEGTRSRTGKSLAPKTGMLCALVEPWLASHPKLLAQRCSEEEGEDEEDVTFVSELYSFLKKIVSFFTMMCSCPLVVTRTDVYGEFPIIIICFFVVDSI